MPLISRRERLRRSLELVSPPCAPVVAPEMPDAPADTFDSLGPLRKPFVTWFDLHISLDAEWLAGSRPEPRIASGLVALHRHLCAWWLEHSAEVPPDLNEFGALPLEAGAAIVTIRGERLIQGVALAEDLAAHGRFYDVPQDLPRPARAAVVVKPEPGYEFTFDDEGRPVMPAGVRLVHWAPLPSPVRLSNCSTITDVDTFIRTTLIQLDHALRDRPWLAGNWGVSELVIRLRAVGCVVELQDARRILQ